LDSIDLENNFPRHIAIIMDGNGRWATRKMLPRIMGHRQGVQTIKNIVKTAHKLKIKVLSLYAFSTENWKRPKDEIATLFEILLIFIKKDFQEFIDNNVKLRILGDFSKFPPNVFKEINNVLEATKNNTGLQLNIALNYGAREELIYAFQKLSKKGIEKPTEQDISDVLYTSGQPDPDLLIRTSGEMRISNFLLWQIAYSEIYCTDTLWPDFSAEDFKDAIVSYQKRQRRFGGL
jgi:undecaprenyl diphosphate synthase